MEDVDELSDFEGLDELLVEDESPDPSSSEAYIRRRRRFRMLFCNRACVKIFFIKRDDNKFTSLLLGAPRPGDQLLIVGNVLPMQHLHIPHCERRQVVLADAAVVRLASTKR